MTSVSLPTPRMQNGSDGYGHARMPRGATMPESEHIDRIQYGRFRNVYLYITEACQLRCEHCYMGERLDRALKMPLPQIIDTLATWRRLGGSKHPRWRADAAPGLLRVDPGGQAARCVRATRQ